jgi:hypothetical protein
MIGIYGGGGAVRPAVFHSIMYVRKINGMGAVEWDIADGLA